VTNDINPQYNLKILKAKKKVAQQKDKAQE
jgi:hypothetical protein